MIIWFVYAEERENGRSVHRIVPYGTVLSVLSRHKLEFDANAGQSYTSDLLYVYIIPVCVFGLALVSAAVARMKTMRTGTVITY